MDSYWSNLPDLCLLALFAHLPLVDLIRTISRVCTNWTRIQGDELKRRSTLVIVQNYPRELKLHQKQDNPYGSKLISLVRRDDGFPWARVPTLDQIAIDVLQVPGRVLTEGFTSSLIDRLPNITNLSIVQRDPPLDSVTTVLKQMVRLIDHYQSSLISLKFDFSFNGTRVRMLPLFDSINRLESLRHLTLNILFPNLNPDTRLSVLSRLKTFTTHGCNPTEWLFSSLTEYSREDVIHIDCNVELRLEKMIRQFDPLISNRFTRIRLRDDLPENLYDDLRLFSSRFNCLTTLWLGNVSMPMTILARCLSPLTQLIHLKINFDSIPPDEQEQPEILTQISSVRLLFLSINFQSHRDTERLHLSELFPNLQVLHWFQRPAKCSVCEYEQYDDILRVFPEMVDQASELRNAMRTRVTNCMRLARKPLRRCANLHTIKLDGNAFKLLEMGLIKVDQL